MIYLIETTYYNKTTNEVIDLLKIGYTKDRDRRYKQYRGCNPLFQVLYEIPGADESKEKALHDYFDCYRYKNYGREWFEYSDEIVEYFKAMDQKYKTRIKEDRENFEMILDKALDRSRNKYYDKENLINSKENIINSWEVMEYGLFNYFLRVIDEQ